MKDLKHQKFGKLIAICPTSKRQGSNIIWLCCCDCGNLTNVGTGNLLTGNTKSCGCQQLYFKHGDSTVKERKRLYRIWAGIKGRCLRPSDSAYKHYGNRGISICERWKNDYLVFKAWAMSHGYTDNLTIDRINNNGNYEPSNCQFITRSENSKKPKYKKLRPI